MSHPVKNDIRSVPVVVPHPSVAAYYELRKFATDSKLFEYLARKCPELISERTKPYNLYEVLISLKRIITEEKLYDPENPTVVLCDHALEDALNVKALHVSEIREQVCKQFHPINQRAHTRQPQGHLGGGQNIVHLDSKSSGYVSENSNGFSQSRTSSVSGNQQSLSQASSGCPDVSPDSGLGRLIPPESAEQSQQVPQESIAPILPSWASADAIAVKARIKACLPFDIEADYLVKPNFLRVLRAVEGVNQTQRVFPYREITSLLSKYIMMKKDQFFDMRNIRVALVDGDILGKAFGVKAFARSQVTALMRAQLMRYVEGQEIPHEFEEGHETDGASVSSGGHEADDEKSDEGKVNVVAGSTKRSRHRSRNLSLNYSSGEETIYSVQGYETVAICDEVSSETDDGSVQMSYSDDDNVYRVEYEVDDGSEDEKEKSKKSHESSDEDSEIESVLVATAVTSMLQDMETSDLGDWADSDSDGFALSNYDPELPNGADSWNCLTCGQANIPFMRYCHRCWQERKGWVPERPKPHKNRKDKKTPGTEVKNSKNGKSSQRNNCEKNGSQGKAEPCSSKSSTALEQSSSQMVSKRMDQIKLGSQGTSSQGSDSGYSQSTLNSQELLSTEVNEEDDVLSPPDKKQKLISCRSFEDDTDDSVLQRNEELPSSAKWPNTLIKTASVVLTPDTDSSDTVSSQFNVTSGTDPKICNMCCVRVKDACFIHGQLSHQVCCYRCAKMIFKSKRPCPVCRRKIEKITRNIVV